jgi:hypothetical protein
MYARADLNGLDLRGQDISFLVGIGAKYQSTLLTNDQRRFLDSKDEALNDRTEVWRSISTMRLRYVRDFIVKIEANFSLYVHNEEGVSEALESALISPIVSNASLSPNMQCGSDYIGTSLSTFASMEGVDFKKNFFLELFSLYGKIQSRGTLSTVLVLDQILSAVFDDSFIAELISASTPSPTLVELWILSPHNRKVKLKRARLLAEYEKISSGTVSKIIGLFESTIRLIEFCQLPNVEFDLPLQNEVLQQFSRSEIAAGPVAATLDGNFNDRFKHRVACAGLASGKRDVLDLSASYLRRSSEGFGGILLEDAILNMPEFESAQRAGARLLHMTQERSFRRLIIKALYSRAKSSDQVDRVARMLRKELPNWEE